MELDPGLVDDSLLPDRIPTTDDPAYDDLVESIAENGQQQPIIVRPHPSRAGRFQIACGHRRTRAAQQLGQTVRAIVRPLSDVQLVVAQGVENSERANLSFIEKALFAFRLNENGFSRAAIRTAIGPSRTDLATMLSLVARLPLEVILAVGPAPAIGRPRWITLDRLLANPSAKSVASAAIADPGFAKLPSDLRFLRLSAALAKPARKSDKSSYCGRNGDTVLVVRRTKRRRRYLRPRRGIRRLPRGPATDPARISSRIYLRPVPRTDPHPRGGSTARRQAKKKAPRTYVPEGPLLGVDTREIGTSPSRCQESGRRSGGQVSVA